MPLNIEQTIDAILTIPRMYHSVKKSQFTLLQETGYFENYNEISEEDIYKRIIDHDDYVLDWLHLSEDKRSLGWYFNFDDENHALVGYLPQEPDKADIEFQDRFRGCAAFIKREIESIRTLTI